MHTSDLLNRTLRLKITALIFPESAPTSPVVCTPKFVSLISETLSDTSKVTIKNITMDTLTASIVYYDEDCLDVQLADDMLDIGGTIDAIVNVRKGREQEYFKKSFTLEFNDAQKTRMSIPVVYSKIVNARTKKGQ